MAQTVQERDVIWRFSRSLVLQVVTYGVFQKKGLAVWFRELPEQAYCNTYVRFYDQLSNSNVNIHKTDVFGRS